MEDTGIDKDSHVSSSSTCPDDVTSPKTTRVVAVDDVTSDEEENGACLDVGQRDFEGRLCAVVDRNKGSLTLKGQINMGADMTVTNTHVHDNRVINKNVQHHHGDVHHNVTNKFIKKGDVIHQHGDLYHTQHMHYNDNEAGYEQIKDQSLTEIMADVELFVKTENYRTAARMLDTSNVLLITGPRESGKSCLGHALLRYHHFLGHTPLVLHCFEEWRQHVGGERKQIVLLEHIFGRDELNTEALKVWWDAIDIMLQFAKLDKCLVIITINDHIVTEVSSEPVVGRLLRFQFNLSNGQPLTDEEKSEILKKHLAKEGRSLQENEIAEILSLDRSGQFFPSRCRQYCQLPTDHPNRADIFTASDEQVHSACGFGPKLQVRISPEVIRRSLQKPQRRVMSVGAAMWKFTGYNNFHLDIFQDEWRADESREMSRTAESRSVFEGDTPLHEACRDLDADAVLRLLREGHDPAAQNKRGRTSLHIACDTGHERIVTLLLQHKSPVDAADTHGWTPLHLASYRGHSSVANLLISFSAVIDVSSLHELTPLHLACMHKHLETARVLLESGANPEARKRLGATPIHAAAYAGSAEIVDLLITNKARTDVQDNKYRTPLHYACQQGHLPVVRTLILNSIPPTSSRRTLLRVECSNGHVELVKSLLQCGLCSENQNGTVSICSACVSAHQQALENITKHNGYTDMTAIGSLTGLYLASQNGHSQVVKLLLGAGACPEIKAESGWTALHVASYNGHDEIVSFLLQVHTTVDAMLEDILHTPLHLASRKGHKRVVDRLVSAGASPYARTCQGQTPLHLACIGSRIGVLDTLIKATQNFELDDFYGQTILDVAVEYGTADIVKKLIEGGASFKFPPGTTTPLHRAVDCSKVETLSVLLELTDDVDVVDSEKRTALQRACERNMCQVVDLLLRHYANPHILTSNRKTLLHIACNHDNASEDIVQTLLDHGVAIAAHDSSGNTALHLASLMGHVSIVQKLLEHNAEVNAANDEGETPLYVASEHCKETVLDLLIQRGADVNTATSNGSSPLHLACLYRHVPTVTKLLEAGADKELKDKEGRTPLRVCSARKECVTIVTLLLDVGANVNVADDHEVTSLHMACSRGEVGLVKTLLQHGADVCCHDNNGSTPLHEACKRDDTVVLIALLENGANLHAADNEGNTPLHHACAKGSAEVARILLKRGASSDVRNKAGNSPLSAISPENRANLLFVFMEHMQKMSSSGSGSGTSNKPDHHKVSEENTDKPSAQATGAGIDLQTEPVTLSHGPISQEDKQYVSAVWPETDESTRKSGEGQASVGSLQTGKSDDTFNTGDMSELETIQRDVRPLFERELGDSEQPLHTACRHGNTEKALELMQKGHSVTLGCQAGRTPLHYACAWGHPVTTETLLENGADAKATDTSGRTPLHYACAWGDLVAVDILMKHGAEIEVKDETGRTPLHWACVSGYGLITAVLLGNKADTSVTDLSGDSPLHLASRYGHNDVTIVLLNNGADVRLKNKQRQTALSMASASGHMQLLQTLERHV